VIASSIDEVGHAIYHEFAHRDRRDRVSPVIKWLILEAQMILVAVEPVAICLTRIQFSENNAAKHGGSNGTFISQQKDRVKEIIL